MHFERYKARILVNSFPLVSFPNEELETSIIDPNEN